MLPTSHQASLEILAAYLTPATLAIIVSELNEYFETDSEDMAGVFLAALAANVGNEAATSLIGNVS
jgi:hypothetical protein